MFVTLVAPRVAVVISAQSVNSLPQLTESIFIQQQYLITVHELCAAGQWCDELADALTTAAHQRACLEHEATKCRPVDLHCTALASFTANNCSPLSIRRSPGMYSCVRWPRLLYTLIS